MTEPPLKLVPEVVGDRDMPFRWRMTMPNEGPPELEVGDQWTPPFERVFDTGGDPALLVSCDVAADMIAMALTMLNVPLSRAQMVLVSAVSASPYHLRTHRET